MLVHAFYKTINKKSVCFSFLLINLATSIGFHKKNDKIIYCFCREMRNPGGSCFLVSIFSFLVYRY